jgi:hypothetical protein
MLYKPQAQKDQILYSLFLVRIKRFNLCLFVCVLTISFEYKDCNTIVQHHPIAKNPTNYTLSRPCIFCSLKNKPRTLIFGTFFLYFTKPFISFLAKIAESHKLFFLTFQIRELNIIQLLSNSLLSQSFLISFF